MNDTPRPSETGPRWQALEFSLVVVMLGVLGALVLLILLVKLDSPLPENLEPRLVIEHQKSLLEYRKDILSIILTAFGAWVGAGAAYFFGRENLREAANSMLQMRNLSPSERLRQILVRDIPPRKIPPEWLATGSDNLNGLLEKLKKDPQNYWFIPILSSTGGLEDVLHKEAVWRYVMELASSNQDFKTETVSDLTTYIRSKEDLKKNFAGIYVEVKPETSVAEASDMMSKKGVFIGIVTDASGKPTEFIDTADIRRVLLRA